MALEKTKLDRSRPFGIIYGTPGLAFEQDGVHFSGNEQPVEEWSSREKIEGERVLAQKRREKEAILAERRRLAASRRKAQEDE